MGFKNRWYSRAQSCGENCVGLVWKKALISVKWCNRNGLRSAINVSKCGHNVTGALLGCRFRDREVENQTSRAVDY
jgi:hypothetical protein